MARSESFSRWWGSESADGFELPLSDSGEAHVLAVDDSLVDRRVIERLLKISSCRVTAVDSGRRALQVLGLDDEKSPVDFHSLKVDMIITDYCMPGMTGYELLKKVKESSALREIPVVIMSSENVLTRIDRCLEEGAEDYIVKPVNLSDVKRLKDYMTRGVWAKSGEGNNHERKLHESSGRLYQSPPSDTLSLSESSSSPAPSSPLSASSFSQPLSPLMDTPEPYSSLFLGIPHRTAQNE